MVDPKRLSSLFAVDRLVFLDTAPAAHFLPSFGVDKAVRKICLLYLLRILGIGYANMVHLQ